MPDTPASETPARARAARWPLDHDPAKVRARRLELGFTLVKAGKRARISAGHLSEVERGIRNPSPEALGRIARALKCRIGDLLPQQADTEAA